MRCPRISIFLAACLLAMVSLRAKADSDEVRMFYREAILVNSSIEHSVARSDLIVRGTITGRNGSIIRIKVIQTLKGPLRNEVGLREIYPPHTYYRPPLGTEVIVFGRRVDGKPDNPIGETVIPPISLDGKDQVFTVDLQALSQPDEILASIQAALTWPNPGTEDVDLDFGSPYMILECPVDSRLENALHRLITSDNHISQRSIAVSGLRSFPNDRTRRLLQSLLTDSASDYEIGFGKWARARYDVRYAAIRLLEAEYPDAKLVPPGLATDGPVLAYRPLTCVHAWLLLLPAALALFLAAVYALHRRRQASPLHPFSIALCIGPFLSIVSLVLAACVLALIFRGRHTTDEVMFTLGKDHHEIATHRGGLQYMVLQNWPTPTVQRDDDWMQSRRPVVGSFDSTHRDCWSLATLSSSNWWSHLGLTAASGSVTSTPTTYQTPNLPVSATFVLLPYSYRFIRISWWLILIPLLLFPARHLLHIHTRHRRLRKGLCPVCGYDLHASPQRCPECGTAR